MIKISNFHKRSLIGLIIFSVGLAFAYHTHKIDFFIGFTALAMLVHSINNDITQAEIHI